MEPETLFKKAQDVGMTDAERTALMARTRALPRAVRSPYSFLTTRLAQQGVAAVLVVTLAGGSTALAASSALPGDVLFPVKIHVNERVETLLAVTPESQAQVATVQASRRLEEAEELVHKGRLTQEMTKEVEANFTIKAEEVKKRVKKLRDSNDNSGADQAEKRFKENIDSHLQSFTEFQKGEGSTTPGVNDVRDTLERHRDSRGSDHEDRKEEIRSSDSGKGGGDSHGGGSGGSGKDD
jgi:uncharacterized membrane protein YgcG